MVRQAHHERTNVSAPSGRMSLPRADECLSPERTTASAPLLGKKMLE